MTTNTEFTELTPLEQEVYADMRSKDDQLRFTYDLDFRAKEMEIFEMEREGFPVLKRILLAELDEETAITLFQKFRDILEAHGDNYYDYTDNWRWCKVGDLKSEKKYKQALKDGCCGYVDDDVVISGDTYKIGFNFGH